MAFERIKREIKHEYDVQLETLKVNLKSEADVKIEKIKVQLKSESDVEIEKLRSNLSIAASERQVRFSRLHETRGTVISEICSALKEFVAALSNYVKIFEPAGDVPRSERASKGSMREILSLKRTNPKRFSFRRMLRKNSM